MTNDANDTKIYADRKKIRKLAEHHQSIIAQAVQNGENAYQISNDQNDEIFRFIADFPDEEKELFLAIYTQEIEAITNYKVEQTQIIEMQQATEERQYESLGQIIGGIIFVIVIVITAGYLFG